MDELQINNLRDLEKEPFGHDINKLSKSEWSQISTYNELSEDFIRKYHDELDWDSLIDAGVLNEKLIEEFSHYITNIMSWEKIAMLYENLSSLFIYNFLNKFSPYTLLEYQKISAKLLYVILRRNKKDRVSLARKALEYQLITPQKIKVFERLDLMEYISWYEMSKFSKLSKSFIEQYKNRINWRVMSKYNKIPEDILTKYKYYVDWDEVSEYQFLSLDTIMNHSNLINLGRLKLNKKVNQEELEEKGIYTMLALIQAK